MDYRGAMLAKKRDKAPKWLYVPARTGRNNLPDPSTMTV
jgi:hypothetical protein